MSPEDHTALWQAINDLREDHSVLAAEVKTGIQEIKTLLQERCEARVARMQAIEKMAADNADSIRRAHARIDELRLDHGKLAAKLSVWATVGSIVGGAAAAAVFRMFGG